MSFSLKFTSAATMELALAVEWYGRKSPALGKKFERAFQTALEAMQTNPQLFQQNEEGIRYRRIDKFPYCVYFRVQKQQIQILSIFHTSRRPLNWHTRN